jgi:hypothetical protein
MMLRVKYLGLSRWAACLGDVMMLLMLCLRGHMLLDGSLVEFRDVTLDDFQRTLRTFADAGSEPITKPVTYDFGFPVHDLKGAFRARCDALAASSAQIFVYLDQLSNDHS